MNYLLLLITLWHRHKQAAPVGEYSFAWWHLPFIIIGCIGAAALADYIRRSSRRR